MPRKDNTTCNHPVLSFGSGDWYVICQQCQLFWRPENIDNYASQSCTIGGVRVDPDTQTAPTPEPNKATLSEGEYYDAVAAVVGRSVGNPVSMNHEQWMAFWKLANAAKSLIPLRKST